LNHATVEQLRPVVTNLLTPRGSLTVDTRTNTLVVTDTEDSIRRLKAVLGVP
jgi:type II secretory pathway component HofQ